MSSEKKLPRRDFLRNAVMLAGAGVTAPLWAAMKYERRGACRRVQGAFRGGVQLGDAAVLLAGQRTGAGEVQVCEGLALRLSSPARTLRLSR